MIVYTARTDVSCHTMHLNIPFIIQLPSLQKYVVPYHIRGQSTDISHVLSKKIVSVYLPRTFERFL
jgi:hypothetical protein